MHTYTRHTDTRCILTPDTKTPDAHLHQMHTYTRHTDTRCTLTPDTQTPDAHLHQTQRHQMHTYTRHKDTRCTLTPDTQTPDAHLHQTHRHQMHTYTPAVSSIAQSSVAERHVSVSSTRTSIQRHTANLALILLCMEVTFAWIQRYTVRR